MLNITETIEDLLHYIVLLFLLGLFYIFIFVMINPSYEDPSNVRYMLSALAQSEAAILAIVITLSLVAVQLTSSSYSPRVIEIVKESPDLKFLMFSYILAIVISLGVLNMMEEIPTSCLKYLIGLSLFLGIFCFSALFPYTWNMFIILKPLTIIDKLSKKITKESLLETKDESIQPIIDIIRSSMMKYDFETTRYGLWAIYSRIWKILKEIKKGEFDEEIEMIFKKIFNHFYRISILAINLKDEDSALEVISSMHTLGYIGTEKISKNRSERILSDLTSFQGRIGIAAMENNFEQLTMEVESNLKSLVIYGGKNELRWIINFPAMMLDDLGIAAIERKNDIATIRIMKLFWEILVEFVDIELEHLIWNVDGHLCRIIVIAAKNKRIEVVTQILDHIEPVTDLITEKKFRDIPLMTIMFQLKLGNVTLEEEDLSLTRKIVKSLGEIGISIATVKSNKIEKVTKKIINFLEKAKKNFTDRKFEEGVLEINRYIKNIKEAMKQKSK